MAAITLKGIEKSYGGAGGAGAGAKRVVVVEKMDLEINDGEFVVLVGPSGCGKSTTLRMIAGLETISGGDLLIDGKRSNDLPPGDRDLAMVFQSYALYPHMSVRENIAYGLRVRRVSAQEIEQRTQEAAAMLGLQPLLERKPKALSGGQRQRVAMARAIVRRPKAFLFDEPLSNLDAKLRMEVRAEIAALQRRFGTTMVYVTHDQVEAMTLADRIVVLNEGVVQQVGPPLELYRKPANRFVATFLGTPTMGIIDFAAPSSSSTAAVDAAPAGKGNTLADLKGAVGAPAGAVAVGARPHDVSTKLGSGVRLGDVDVDLVERLGQEAFAFGKLHGARIGALVHDDDIKAGVRVPLYAPREKLHFFDANGARMSA